MYTSKPTKNIITKETITRELWEMDKRNLILFCATFLVMAILCVGFVFIFLGIAIKDANEIVRPFAWGFFVFVLALFAYVEVFFGFMIFTSIRSIKNYGGRKFAVITDEVNYKYEKTVYSGVGKRRSVRVEKTLHFCKCGDFRVGDTAYDIASEGDEYYIVVSHKASTNVLKIYAKKMYEYRE